MLREDVPRHVLSSMDNEQKHIFTEKVENKNEKV